MTISKESFKLSVNVGMNIGNEKEKKEGKGRQRRAERNHSHGFHNETEVWRAQQKNYMLALYSQQ
jgi:hypothetical protein